MGESPSLNEKELKISIYPSLLANQRLSFYGFYRSSKDNTNKIMFIVVFTERRVKEELFMVYLLPIKNLKL